MADCDELNGISAVPWIADIFGECLYTWNQYLSFSMGLISILGYMMANFPQLYRNYKNSNAKGLSLLLVCFWVFGDACNVFGCFLTDQLQTQKFAAMYFIFNDMVLLTQTVYYQYIKPNCWYLHPYGNLDKQKQMVEIDMKQLNQIDVIKSEDLQIIDSSKDSNNGKQLPVYFLAMIGYSVFSSFTISYTTNIFTGPNRVLQIVNNENFKVQFGRVLGFMSMSLYLLSRFPQLYKNYKHKKVCVSFIMFGTFVVSSLLYSFSIFSYSIDYTFLYAKLPYLLSSFGCTSLDFILFGQYLYYSRFRKTKTDIITV